MEVSIINSVYAAGTALLMMVAAHHVPAFDRGSVLGDPCQRAFYTSPVILGKGFHRGLLHNDPGSQSFVHIDDQIMTKFSASLDGEYRVGQATYHYRREKIHYTNITGDARLFEKTEFLQIHCGIFVMTGEGFRFTGRINPDAMKTFNVPARGIRVARLAL